MREYIAPVSSAADGSGVLPISSPAGSTSGGAPASAVEHLVAVAGRLLVRYGFVVVVAWIGALKYTRYEAVAIQPLALSGVPGQFLLKGLVLFGAALWTLGVSLGTARSRAHPARQPAPLHKAGTQKAA